MSQKKLGQQTWAVTSGVRVLASAAVVGPKEGQGLLKNDYDAIYSDTYAGQDTWERAERKMLEDAVDFALHKSGYKKQEIDLYIAGDLMNQIIVSSFSAKALGIPHMGVFSACASSMQSVTLGALFIEGGLMARVVAGVSSHNSSSERQFRYPTEYGGQKPPMAGWTATGAGAVVLGHGKVGPLVTHCTIGKVIDLGVKDPFNLGAAMAPAAAHTIEKHLSDTGRTPDDYDLIVTGDLRQSGYNITKELLRKKDIIIGDNYQDCGLMIYDPKQRDYGGASGCASSAIVTYGHIFRQMARGKYRKVLVVATGALFSPISFQQKESIPCVAHAVSFELG
ncbi:stage V sporulation protein AD [Numidum massiliense]|uniref:stage V sporulation protein AD n=1 Tax=Numidum massiliense TaxID=1522315 RepID=UPI0006D54318|nr:stage V sporulation protein AD [Numidum massiliense]